MGISISKLMKWHRKKDERFAGVFKHSIEYTISMLLVILPVVNRGLIKWVLLYSTSHFIIDTIKYKLLAAKKNKENCQIVYNRPVSPHRLHICNCVYDVCKLL